MKTLIFAVILTFGFSGFFAFGDGFVPTKQTKAPTKQKKFPSDYFVEGVGSVHVDYKYSGEPVSEPAKLFLSVVCNGSTKSRPIGRPISMGDEPEIYYKGDTKNLMLKYHTCRTEPAGQVTCDQGGQWFAFPLSDVCSAGFRAPNLDPEIGSVN